MITVGYKITCLESAQSFWEVTKQTLCVIVSSVAGLGETESDPRLSWVCKTNSTAVPGPTGVLFPQRHKAAKKAVYKMPADVYQKGELDG